MGDKELKIHDREVIGVFATMLLSLVSNRSEFYATDDGRNIEAMEIEKIDDLIYECIERYESHSKEESSECPYCKIKKIADTKLTYAGSPAEGRCTCGAWLDRGQQSLSVNSYVDIYKGALKLMEKMVDEFNYWLDYFGVDVEDYMEDGEKPRISLSTVDIIDELFLGNYGGTTKRNFINALGIEEDSTEFELCRDLNIY